MNGHPLDRKLLETGSTRFGYLEFTTRCNIKCIYCGSRFPDYKGEELDPRRIEGVIETLSKRNVERIYVSGHGETTIVKDWHLYCDKLLDHGLRLEMITNLAKRLSDKEADTLSKFDSIVISCDTSNPDLFRVLRPGADLRQIVLNMGKIKAMALENSRPFPRFGWSVVVCDQTVLGLRDLAYFGLAQGVSHFTFANFVDYHVSGDKLTRRHVCELETPVLETLPRLFQEINLALASHSAESYFQQPLLDCVDAELHSRSSSGTVQSGSSERRVEHEYIYTTTAEYSQTKMTRNCLDPWDVAYIRADARVQLCCLRSEILGDLEKEGLECMLNGDLIKEYREGLLTGDLKECCQTCNGRGWIPVSKLQKAVRSRSRPMKEAQASSATSSPPLLFQLSRLVRGCAWDCGRLVRQRVQSSIRSL